MSLVMLCFPCCVDEQPPPRRRPKIDRNMIGAPTNFKHTGHIGSGEVSTGFDIHNVQDQMQSKGGYKYTCALSEKEPDGLDLTANEKDENDINVIDIETNELNNEDNVNVEKNDDNRDSSEPQDDKDKEEQQDEDAKNSSPEPNRTSEQEDLRQTGLC